jgi:hypothetical protein
VPRGQVGHGAGQASARRRGGLARSDRVNPPIGAEARSGGGLPRGWVRKTIYERRVTKRPDG